jgi:hypothetical protein
MLEILCGVWICVSYPQFIVRHALPTTPQNKEMRRRAKRVEKTRRRRAIEYRYYTDRRRAKRVEKKGERQKTKEEDTLRKARTQHRRCRANDRVQKRRHNRRYKAQNNDTKKRRRQHKTQNTHNMHAIQKTCQMTTPKQQQKRHTNTWSKQRHHETHRNVNTNARSQKTRWWLEPRVCKVRVPF